MAGGPRTSLRPWAFLCYLGLVFVRGSNAFRVRLGVQKEYLDTKGQTWQADPFGQGTSQFAPSRGSFSSVDNAELYGQAVIASDGQMLNFSLPVSEVGRHLLKIHIPVFPTKDFPGIGRTSASITAGGATLLQDFNAYEEATILTGNRPLFSGVTKEFVLLLGGHHLTLTFSASRGRFAAVSALELSYLPGFEYDLSTRQMPAPGGAYLMSASLAPAALQPQTLLFPEGANAAHEEDKDEDPGLLDATPARRRLDEIMEQRRILATASCLNCPKSGAGLSRCFLCKGFLQPPGTYYSTKKCKTAYCSYQGGKTYPRAKSFR